MSEERRIAGVPEAFVKGGTTSSAWDRQKARQYAESDARRAYQDRQRRAVKRGAQMPNVMAGLLSKQLSHPANMKVVLKYKAPDSALDQDCICELIRHPVPDDPTKQGLILALVCPECTKRTGREDDAQCIIRSWVREFWLDERPGIYIDPLTGIQVNVAGTITTRDKVSCPALGCSWKFRIDNSELWGSHHYRM